MNCDFIDLKQETINCKGVNFGNLCILFLLYLTGYWLPGYLLFSIVLSGLQTCYLLLVARWRPQISHV